MFDQNAEAQRLAINESPGLLAIAIVADALHATNPAIPLKVALEAVALEPARYQSG
jgi:hypothetical protein